MKNNDLTSKTFRFVIAIVFLVAILVVIQINYFHSDKDKKQASKRTTFTVGFDAAFPPYGYKDESGEYVGFDLDLAQEVADRNGWKLVKQPIDWDSKDMELKTGSIDCIWNGFTINGRENNYTWSKAYVDNSQVIVVKSDSGIEKKADLKGKNVMVQTDSSALEAFTGEDADEENKALCKTFAELQQVSDYNNAFLNLESGSADALCMDIGVASYEVEHRGDDYKILDERISSELYGIGFKLGNTGLRDEVQETLDKMKNDGTFEKIAEKWELSDFVCLGKPGTDEAYKKDKDEKKTSESGMFDTVKELAKGMLSSLLIFVFTLIFSMPLGLLVMAARRSKFIILSTIAKVYISILRGTPLMLQLLVVFLVLTIYLECLYLHHIGFMP